MDTIPQEIIADALKDCTLPELLRHLAIDRQEAQKNRDAARAIIEAIKASEYYQNLEASAKFYELEAAALDAEIRARAVAGYDGTNKHPLPGVNLQEKTHATIISEQFDAARQYALEKAPGLVQIDLKGFEKIAIKLAGTAAALPFFVVDKVVVATIASDLSEYLLKSEQS